MQVDSHSIKQVFDAEKQDLAILYIFAAYPPLMLPTNPI